MAEEQPRRELRNDRDVRLACLELAQRVTFGLAEDDQAIVDRAKHFADFVLGSGNAA